MTSKKTQETMAKTMAKAVKETKNLVVKEELERAMARDAQAAGLKVKVDATGRMVKKPAKKEKVPSPTLDVQVVLAGAKKWNLKVEESGSQHKVLGVVKGERLAIAKNGRLADFIAFTIKHDAVQQFTKEEAKAKHIGKVQGRYAPTSPATDLEVISKALKHLARKA